MRLWRSSDHADLSGRGGVQFSGRWHTRGHRIVYLSDHSASALLEILVHLEVDPEDLPGGYQLLAVDIPEHIALATIDAHELAPDWRDNAALTRELGDRWLAENRTALLRVPSAIVPSAVNWLFNPAHPDSAQAHIAEVTRTPFDPRLLKSS
jgi:RES domain-containing protein